MVTFFHRCRSRWLLFILLLLLGAAAAAAPPTRLSCKQAGVPVVGAFDDCIVLAQANLGSRRASVLLTRTALLAPGTAGNAEPTVPAVFLVIQEPGGASTRPVQVYRVEDPPHSPLLLSGDVHAAAIREDGVLLINYPEKWGQPTLWWLAWPEAGQAALRFQNWTSYRFDRVLTYQQRSYYAGINGQRRVLLALNGAGQPEIVTGSTASAVLAQLPVEHHTYGAPPGQAPPSSEIWHPFEDEQQLRVTAPSGATCEVHFRYAAAFETDPGLLYRHANNQTSTFPLRRFTAAEYQQRRSDAGDPYLRPVSDEQLRAAVGPIQAEGSRIWFGRTFYDAEGLSGIGGFGYLDCESGEFREFFPKFAIKIRHQKFAIRQLNAQKFAIRQLNAHIRQGSGIRLSNLKIR